MYFLQDNEELNRNNKYVLFNHIWNYTQMYLCINVFDDMQKIFQIHVCYFSCS